LGIFIFNYRGIFMTYKAMQFAKVLVGASILSCTVWANNLLPNPGFEDGTQSWKVQPNGGAELALETNATAANTGSLGAQVHVTTVTGDDWHAQLQLPNTWTAKSGQEYTVGFYAKSENTVSIQVAIQGGPPASDYKSGTNYTVGNDWRYIEHVFTADEEGVGAIQINIFVGNATGKYFFDDFSLVESGGALPATIAPVSEAAIVSKTHRNIFLEMGKTTEQVNTKVQAAYQQLFFGDPATEALYFPVGTDMAFIKAIDSDDIRSEGQSYAMMIAVQLDQQEVFDKLWKFAKTYSQHQDGDLKGYFSWQLQATAPFAMIDVNPAPDGEEYFAMALFFAAKRWGNKEGIFNYEAEANFILDEMVNKTPNSTALPMMNHEHKMITFTTDANSDQYTDPSYHLPAFYELWALWAAKDNDYWKEVADTSRAFWKRNCHPTTGLGTEYANFDGTPKTTNFNSNSHLFAYDSHRTGMNIAMDYNWFKKDEWQVEQSNRMLNFFASQATGYVSIYTPDGTPQVTEIGESLRAMNAVAAMAADDAIAWEFIDDFWKMATPSGTYRYYNGLLSMMAWLHLSGQFRIWGIAETSTLYHTLPKESGENIGYDWTVNGNTLHIHTSDLQHGSILILGIDATVLGSAPIQDYTSNITINNLNQGVYIVKIASNSTAHVSKIIIP
jgi:endo-1,4-beta-D-glucanase Y